MTRYVPPGGFTRHVLNPLIRRLTRWGIPVAGSRELRVRGRTSGQWRATPVNLLTVDGHDYLVAPRGTTQWVRNIRVNPDAELRVGRRVRRVRAVEVRTEAKGPVLRRYLAAWEWEVGQFFDGVDASATDEQLAGVAGEVPVFELLVS